MCSWVDEHDIGTEHRASHMQDLAQDPSVPVFAPRQRLCWHVSCHAGQPGCNEGCIWQAGPSQTRAGCAAEVHTLINHPVYP